CALPICMVTAVIITGDGSLAYPALTGTGWNDGHLDFTNNYMQNLCLLFDMHSTEGIPTFQTPQLVHGAFFIEAAPGLDSDRAIGQFFPGAVGGANGTSGFSAKSLVNPFDFVLMLEGCLCFSASVNRMFSSKKIPQAAAPFAVRSAAVGFGSGASADESARGEQWMPLWEKPLSYQSLIQFMGEGRSQCNRKTSQRPFDFAMSVARLGVTRGITEFQRFGFIERNGQANLATPLGRWKVESQPNQHLLDEITPWLDTLRRTSRDKNAPARIVRASRTCDEALMSCCRSGHDPNHWLRMLTALGDAEAQLVGSPKTVSDPKKNLRPLPLLSSGWVLAADTGKPELRLALALALQGGFKSNGKPDWTTTIRHHFVPLDVSSYRFAPSSDAYAWKNELIGATDLERTARGIVHRRLIQQKTTGTFPLGPTSHATTFFSDLLAFLEHRTDDALILSLVRPLMAIRKPSGLQTLSRPLNDTKAGDLAIYALLKLCHLPWPIPVSEHGIAVRTDPAIFARLQAGDLHQAVAIAVRRLKASGLRPHIETAMGTEPESYRLAAALAFPLSPSQTKTCALSLTKPTMESATKKPSDERESVDQ
ncbi:MAG: type I-U CRISPR-associated protein Csx17, partial [Desulfoplanes sp.]|nr:type I-U CRISPR-associated protein Csx17 [Desulfoplanes sp.]